MQASFLPYAATHSFSPLLLAYLAVEPMPCPTPRFSPDKKGILASLEARKSSSINREVLVEVLEEQYKDLPFQEKAINNISSLKEPTTFTVCTAHQPNLATGYLYFVYKILHAIKLADELNALHPNLHFVPVYYMGSEDNDLAELGVFRYGGQQYRWDADGQTGAVGRMKTDSLTPLLEELFSKIGPPGKHQEKLELMLREAYLLRETIGAATQFLVHALFGSRGLVVLDADDARLKREFLPVMQDDLLRNTAKNILEPEDAKTGKTAPQQAFARPINSFYLKENIRERIEKDGEKYNVLNTDISFSEAEIIAELDAHPERFSPNVILRPLYQETILPNVAFIGGGSEVAYWLQLQEVFAHYKVFLPAILLRQSVLVMDEKAVDLQQKLALRDAELFLSLPEMEKLLVTRAAGDSLDFSAEKSSLESILQKLAKQAEEIDTTLKGAAGAVSKKINHQLDILKKKMIRAEKRNQEVMMTRAEKLKNLIFPGGTLQERREIFMAWYLDLGEDFFDALYEKMRAMDAAFLILKPEQTTDFQD